MVEMMKGLAKSPFRAWVEDALGAVALVVMLLAALYLPGIA